jgi:hypothetical protein
MEAKQSAWPDLYLFSDLCLLCLYDVGCLVFFNLFIEWSESTAAQYKNTGSGVRPPGFVPPRDLEQMNICNARLKSEDRPTSAGAVVRRQ